ncbi:hypothetical protein V493_08558 [Pseudogymnoascus sp. VKM F-4281 (FW-2241)]|nr:hypothetical protein V493_08558 [Pseudogymnoascus sp. VKM F-4281 (FW-2241)]
MLISMAGCSAYAIPRHFVPQFLLKNFSHPYKPQNDGSKTSKRSKRKYDKGKYPGDTVVRNLNLTADLPVICKTPVRRILGQIDMYRDRSKPSLKQQHIEQMFSKLESICTPSDPNVDEDSGKVEATAYTPLYEFAPISPKLILVLRSFMFPVPEEDANVDVKEHRELFRSMALNIVYKREVKSLLDDLPIKKACNNYSEIVDGSVQLINGEDRKKRKDHKFYFTFFPIDTKHVNAINGILLDNAYP